MPPSLSCTAAQACEDNTKGYSSTYLAMGFANVRAGTQKRSMRLMEMEEGAGRARYCALRYHPWVWMTENPAATTCGNVSFQVGLRASIGFGRISAPFPPAVAHRLLLSSLTAAIE